MQLTAPLAFALLASYTSAHGVLTMIQGANGVDMPGLSIVDGTPRTETGDDAQADTSIIRDDRNSRRGIGPLGRYPSRDPVDGAAAVATFMGGNAAGAASVSAAAANVDPTVDDDNIDDEDDEDEEDAAMAMMHRKEKRQRGGALETMVASTAGLGATEGMPTASDDGVVTLVYHQVNGDGAGPLVAEIDATSGGTQLSAFQTATIMTDVPGRRGRSDNEAQDFPLVVQMPAGMVCEGTMAGVDGLCVVRVMNPLGFGGSAAFTQSPAARKRALEVRALKARTVNSRVARA